MGRIESRESFEKLSSLVLTPLCGNILIISLLASLPDNDR